MPVEKENKSVGLEENALNQARWREIAVRVE